MTENQQGRQPQRGVGIWSILSMAAYAIVLGIIGYDYLSTGAGVPGIDLVVLTLLVLTGILVSSPVNPYR